MGLAGLQYVRIGGIQLLSLTANLGSASLVCINTRERLYLPADLSTKILHQPFSVCYSDSDKVQMNYSIWFNICNIHTCRTSLTQELLHPMHYQPLHMNEYVLGSQYSLSVEVLNIVEVFSDRESRMCLTLLVVSRYNPVTLLGLVGWSVPCTAATCRSLLGGHYHGRIISM